MSRTKNILDDLELTLTPEERAERRDASELDARREENRKQFEAFRPSRMVHNNNEEHNH